MNDAVALGDPIPAGCEVIEVRVAEVRRLFHLIDPAPLPDRDLDPRIEEFIVEWGREVPRDTPLALLVQVDGPEGPGEDAALVRHAIHRYFSQRGEDSRRRLRRLFQVGRTSLAIGLAALAGLLGLGQLIASRLPGSGIGELLRESLSIGGWVAMWRPLEIFLYDWWPIRAEARLFDRMAAMPVRIQYRSGPAMASPD